MGRLSDTIRAGLRRHEHGSHVVIYKEQPDHVLIVAVVHGRRVKGLKL
jgi:toxin ParE1/3/4